MTVTFLHHRCDVDGVKTDVANLEVFFFPCILTDWKEAFAETNIRDRIPGCETQVEFLKL